MKTKTINLYEFKELTPDAQKKAIENGNFMSDYNSTFLISTTFKPLK